MTTRPATESRVFFPFLLLAAFCVGPACSKQKPVRPTQDAPGPALDQGEAREPDGPPKSDGDRPEGSVGPEAPAASYCLPRPTTAAGAELDPELPATPRVLWSKRMSSLGGVPGNVVMSSEAVAVTAGNGLAVLNKATGLVKSFASLDPESFSEAVVTDDGLFLLAGKKAHAVDGAGQPVWSVDLPGGPPIGNEWSQCRLLYSGGRQLLVTVCNNGMMYGLDAKKPGKLLWQSRVYTSGMFDVTPAPSVGGAAVFRFADRHAQAGAVAFDPASGQKLGLAQPPNLITWSLSSRGFLAMSPRLALLDECGRTRWQATSDGGIQVPMIVGGADERIFLVERAPGGPARLGMMALADGRRLAGPTGAGSPVAAGADGTFYAVDCDNTSGSESDSPPDLVAYNGTLDEKWRVELPVPPVLGKYHRCPRPGVALDADGVMYLAVEAEGSHLIAVQTRSPGVARTLWPLRTRGHNGSLWHDGQAAAFRVSPASPKTAPR